jgi:hypothetical protein
MQVFLPHVTAHGANSLQLRSGFDVLDHGDQIEGRGQPQHGIDRRDAGRIVRQSTARSGLRVLVPRHDTILA